MTRPLKHLDVPWTVGDAIGVGLAWIVLPAVVFSLPFAPIQSFVAAVSNNDVNASFIYVLGSAALAGGLLALVLTRRGASVSDLGFRSFNVRRTVLYFFIGFVGFLVVANGAESLVHHLVPNFNPNQPQVNNFTQGATSHRLLSILALVVIPPFIEESLFRGFLFPAFSKRWGVIWGAIVTSVVFGLAHGQANVSLYTMVLSLLLCMMYYKLGSLWPGIALHMLNNYLAFVALTSK